MQRSNGVTSFFVMVLFVVGALPPAPFRFYVPAQAQDQHDDDPFPVGPTCYMRVFDPRWSNVHLFYSLVDGDKVMVEGDIILGTKTEVLRQSFANAVTAAKEAGGQSALMRALPSDKERAAVRRLAKRQPDALKNAGGPMLDKEVKEAVDAVEPLLGLRPMGPPQGDEERQAVAVLAGASCEFRWPKGLIPYEVAGVDHPDLIRKAIEHWQEHTNWNIRFEKRTAANAGQYTDYVRFEKGTKDCYAYSIGRRPGLGTHRVTLASGCKEPQIIHEIGHIVGLFHEHCRADRDRWIQIDDSNMDKNASTQFGKIGWMDARILTAFDFDSVMLYPFKAFAADLKKAPTILIKKGVQSMAGSPITIPKDPADFGLKTGIYGGKTIGLSKLDVEGVKKMYFDKPCGPGQ